MLKFVYCVAAWLQNPTSETAIAGLYKLYYATILRAFGQFDFWAVTVRFPDDSILEILKTLIFQPMKIGKGFAVLKISQGKELTIKLKGGFV